MNEAQEFKEQFKRLQGQPKEVQVTFLWYFYGSLEFHLEMRGAILKRGVVSSARNAADYALKGGNL
jgi:hypothetical protein